MSANTKNNDFFTGGVLSGEDAEKIASKSEDIQRLASSSDGRTVRELLDGAGLDEAVSSGDMSAVLSAIRGALSTEAGSRFMDQLRDVINRKDAPQ